MDAFTRHPDKPPHYDRETYFREAYHDFHSVLGDQTEVALRRHGVVIVKPEALTLGLAPAILDFYLGNGFTVAAARPVVLTPLTLRALWHYQFTLASLDRLAAYDLVLAGTGSFLLLRDSRPLELPAAVRLSELKGPPAVEEQPDDCLRRAIRQPNRIFSLLHTADEPVDLIREAGILFDPAERRALAAAMVAEGPSEESLIHLEETRRAAGARRASFDVAASRARIEAAIEGRLAALPAGSAEHARLERAKKSLAKERPLRLTSFLSALADAGVEVHRWDLGVALTGLISYDVPGASKEVANLGPRPWTAAVAEPSQTTSVAS